MITITSREFNKDVSAAERAAEAGPVTITDHGRPAYVLLTAEEYDRLTGTAELVGGRFRMADGEQIDLPIPGRKNDSSLRATEL